MSVSIRVTGLDQATRVMRGARSGLHEALGLIVKDVADSIFADSQRLVPVDRGTLKDSGNVELTGELSAAVGYSAPYAAAVHNGFPEQDVTVRRHERRIRMAFGRKIPAKTIEVRRHSRHIGPREARPYLDDAVKLTLPKIGGIIKKQLAEMWKKLRRG